MEDELKELLPQRGDDDNLDDRSVESDYAMWIMVSAKHLLKDNPAIKEVEDLGKKDKDYTQILHHIRNNI